MKIKMNKLQKGLVIKAVASNFYVEYQNNVLLCKGSTKLKKK